MRTVLDEIDDVLTNWLGSADAMRWAPPFDEPIIREPREWRVLTDVEGLDGYAAQAYVAWQGRKTIRAFAAAAQQSVQQMAETIRSLTEAFSAADASLKRFGVIAEFEPDDPFLRMIERKRRRPAPPGVDLATQKRRS